MNKRLLIILIVFIANSMVNSQTISLHQAELVAANFYTYSNNYNKSKIIKIQPRIKNHTTTLYTAVYEDNNWVLIAADKRAEPILAYSDEKIIPTKASLKWNGI